MSIQELTTTLPVWIAERLEREDAPPRATRSAALDDALSAPEDKQRQMLARALSWYVKGRKSAEKAWHDEATVAVDEASGLPPDPQSAAIGTSGGRRSRVFGLCRVSQSDKAQLAAWAQTLNLNMGVLAVAIQLSATEPKKKQKVKRTA